MKESSEKPIVYSVELLNPLTAFIDCDETQIDFIGLGIMVHNLTDEQKCTLRMRLADVSVVRIPYNNIRWILQYEEDAHK